MRKRTYEALIVGLVLTAWISVQARADANTEQRRIKLRAGASLVFSQPLKIIEAKAFGPGWKKAVFVEASGSEIPLFKMEFFASMGGLIFSGDYSPRISPSGKYAVLDVLRAGVVDNGPSGAAENSSRQYCPVLDTASGCIVSMQTGELCGGDWSGKTDVWVVTGYGYDATKAMIEYGFSEANDLWSQFLKSTKLNGVAKMKQYVIDNLGVANLMACEPPTASNRNSYTLIARQLVKEGDRSDARYIEKKLAVAAIDLDHSKDLTIRVTRTYLYYLPDLKAQTKLYLVKGDTVKQLNKSGEDWVRIEYVEGNGTTIDRWIRSTSIK